MQNLGKILEQEFKNSCRKQEIWVYRLKDSYVVNKRYDPNAYVVSQPADYLAHYNGELFFCELKETEKKFITIAHDDKNGQIKVHQQEDLIKVEGEHEHGIFVLQFLRGTLEQCTYCMRAVDLKRFVEESGRASITPLLCVQYGGVVLTQVKQRVHFIYDIKEGLEKILEGRQKNGR